MHNLSGNYMIQLKDLYSPHFFVQQIFKGWSFVPVEYQVVFTDGTLPATKNPKLVASFPVLNNVDDPDQRKAARRFRDDMNKSRGYGAKAMFELEAIITQLGRNNAVR